MKGELLQSRSVGITTITLLAVAGMSSMASADPLPGEVLKFQQLPLDGPNPNGVNVPGTDVLSTAMANTSAPGFSGTFAADDFSDKVTSNITHVQWWGSYLNVPAGQTNPNPVQHFLISFEADVPAGQNSAGGFSEPGTVLSQQVVTVTGSPLTSASGDFTETLQDPSSPEPLYRYNAELANPFPEVANTIYWLKIVALNGPNDTVQWGWHNRDYGVQDLLAAPVIPGELNIGNATSPVWHFQDDAVSGSVTFIPGQSLLETGMSPLLYNTTTDGFAPGAAPPSEDLSFGLYYSVPEPVTLPAVAGGLLMIGRKRKGG